MAKEWNEFWRKSNEFDYEGTAGGEHNTMIRRANELHGELQPINWKKFKATDIFDREVYGTYLGERIAVDRLDYDAYVALEHHEVITTEDGEVRGYVMGNERVTGPGLYDFNAYGEDKELLKAPESGLYDYGHYGSYMVKKQQNEATDMQEDKSTDTYHNHIASLYKEKAMNADNNIDANAAVSGDINNSIRPSHYWSQNPDVPPIQMWDYALSQNLGFFEGNIIKYVSRWRNKGGVQDLQKALTYLQRLIDSQGSPNP